MSPSFITASRLRPRRGTKKFHGYGFCVFTLEALTVVEKNIQDTFSENGNHPLVKLVANEKLKSAYKKNKRLVSSYTESVLVKEACSVIMQEQIDVKPGEHKDANILQKSSTWLTTPYGRKMCKDKSGIVALQTPVYC
ncbi:hypothetical protein DPMN_142543 [Dreissena polymorpha]|uniref:Uncharacterized protein n=1 Tax=Dreissena polymorpha TaxID=45954 RepID=A0A9D4GFJ7_DREPO|nr:hypothetical protein DPMN_142543 [Dreissena polymorpha]